ncbi:MAG: hypothetical protein ACRD5K_11795, partial [Candidatus Acidiferrales bacterium]
SSAPRPSDGTPSDIVDLVSAPLAPPVPCKVCHYRLSQNRGSLHQRELYYFGAASRFGLICRENQASVACPTDQLVGQIRGVGAVTKMVHSR